MFELFKKRDFSSYISDTIAFFKTFGKHFFKNYAIINGGFLLILCVLMYFIFKIYFEVLFANTGAEQGSYFLQYFNENFALFVASFILFGILIIVLSLLNVAYPIIYLQLVGEKKGAEITISEIVVRLKQNTGRLLKFFLGLLFIIMPIIILVFALLIVLCFILIGFPLLLIAAPATMAWIYLSFYTYLTQETSFFTAIKNGFSLLKQQFWGIVGTTFVVLMLIQIIQSFLTMIPYLIGIVAFLTSNRSAGWNTDNSSSLGIFISIIFIFAVLLSYFFNNLVIINQGIIYYSLREENENLTSNSQIDLIGTDNE
ncbi:hypothetical protein SGQ44_04775 [Flavobacterium sp. Fl-77]|uniref:Glycerophosphoryl diester phosphodiesterase membrane domain-containing protein n=1 Tax=Flavobacterium flavipigmentatum TaxID=2893884 RepID=A0AAJ2VXB2_9FLAO|nr:MULTISPECIES: hypothetical protein [unclassified Flavobacterium]MDX6181911.1 hypothetical protein [Flavobacterium sp. Fl-33]MDX6185055.1 hypothetical protein [Flavobacterium sp. Fl-77]UFH37165.1 hypothetical protein LNP22_10505 [Flavobacterium sp. F-70]